ncbi:ISKra4 family transposase [Deinococcus saxicola]|uniref:ISKra4 family transposase n=2 Tax=Deinococcus saxicola TaxID=249406 RepID=UPI0039EE2A2D
MQIRLQVTLIEGDQEDVHDLGSIERGTLNFEPLGLSLEEGKAVLHAFQTVLMEQQISQQLEGVRPCPDCGVQRRMKGHHHVLLHTVYGDISVNSPRWWRCACDVQGGTFSPLSSLMPENTTPELLFLQTKWASVVSYGATVDLLRDVLPMGKTLNAETVRKHVYQVAQRAEDALGAEQAFFVEGCQQDWDALPMPDGPLTVGIDGGFVRATGKGWFEVIAGKSILAFKRDQIEDRPSSKTFAFVTTHDRKPRRRLFEMLRSQGLQENQAVTFMSDGGDNVRNLQLYLSPNAEHVLDWFHVTMRLTVLGQMARGLPGDIEALNDVPERLERAKHHLWHGHVGQGCEELSDLEVKLSSALDSSQVDPTCLRKMKKYVMDMMGYIGNIKAYMVNYGERYRAGERISTGFIESAVNQVISKRFVKKQSMGWTPRGAHLLLQIRTRVLNNELEDLFRQWYPAFRKAA